MTKAFQDFGSVAKEQSKAVVQEQQALEQQQLFSVKQYLLCPPQTLLATEGSQFVALQS